MKDKQIEVVGVAKNVKEGAIIGTKEGIYYIDSLDYWDGLTGKKVRVKGVLSVIKSESVNSEDELVEQGFNMVLLKKS